MTLVKLNPAMPELYNIMNNVFDRSPLLRAGGCSSVPASNIYEDEHGFTIEMSVPGFNKDDFQIKLDNHIITISSEKNNDENNTTKVLRQEFIPSSFTRSFTLAENVVDESSVIASYEAGILTLKMAKREEAKPKPARTIAVV